MDIGIFTRTFERPTLAETLDAVVAHGLRCIQLNFPAADAAQMPDRIEPAMVDIIRDELERRQITLAALSGTFNIIHPDTSRRVEGMHQLRDLAAVCGRLGTSVLTLSTGTRNPNNMWRPHPENQSEGAWREMLAAMREIAVIGETYGVTMAFEPEVNNVVDRATSARRLLDELGSPWVKVVMDGANIFHAGELPLMSSILTEAVTLLANDTVIAHAKDLDHDGDAGHLAAGHGLLDYDLYLRLLHQSGFSGPLILHGLTEAQAPGCVAFLREKLAMLGRR